MTKGSCTHSEMGQSRPTNILKLSCSSIWATYLWNGWTNGHNVSLPEAIPWQAMYLAMAVSLVAVSLSRVSVKRSHKLNIAQSKKAPIIDGVCACFMALTTIVTSMAGAFGFNEFLIVSMTIIGGLSLGWTYLRWGLFYSTIGARQAILSIFVAGVTWAFLEIFLSMLPLLLSGSFVAVMPFISLFMLREAQKDTLSTIAPTQRFLPDSLTAMWKVWVVILVVSLTTSTFIASNAVVSGVSPSLFAVINFCLIALLSFAIIVWALKTSLPFDFPLFWRLVTFVLAGGLLLAAIDPEMAFVSVFFRVAPGILIPTTWLTVCDIAKHSGPYRCAVVGLGLGTYTLSSFLGTVVYSSFTDIASIQIICTALLFLLFIVSGLCLETRDPDVRRIFEDIKEPTRMLSEFTSVGDRCVHIGARYDLTQREIEVMQMICIGRSRTFIAETLFVSENTVKSHVSHIYGKLGIHSKQELQNMIDS